MRFIITSCNMKSVRYISNFQRINPTFITGSKCFKRCYPASSDKKAVIKQPDPHKIRTETKEAEQLLETNYSSFCVDLVRKHEYESFLCGLLLKGLDIRSFVFAVRSFNVEIALIRDQVSQKEIGIGRLAFWRDAINQIFQSNNKEQLLDIPRHPVVLQLNKVLKNRSVSKKWFVNLMDAREQIMNDAPFNDLTELEAYCDKSVSPILYLGFEALGIKNVDVDHACSHLGKAIGLTNFIRSIPYNAQRRRVLIPQELLVKHKVSQENFIRFTNKEKVTDAVFDIASQAHVHYKHAIALKSSIPKEGLPLTLIGVPTDIYLKRLQNAQFNPFDPYFTRVQKVIVMEVSPSVGNLVYRKLLPGCKLSDEPIGQPEFDLTLQYIKKCFPKAAKLQKDVDQTLKRTFLLEESERKRKYLTKKKPIAKKEGSNRKMRLKKERMVPRNLNYQTFTQLNSMWKSYISDLLQDEERPEEIQLKLNRVDLHGSFLTVVDANCKDYVGLEGIVVKESRNLFIIVTSSGITKSIPKAENVFHVSLDDPKGSLKICGNAFLTRPAERASKKMKSFMEFVGARVYKSRLRYTWPK